MFNTEKLGIGLNTKKLGIGLGMRLRFPTLKVAIRQSLKAEKMPYVIMKYCVCASYVIAELAANLQ